MRLIDADTLLQDLENDFSKVNKEKLSENDYLVIRTAHIALSKFIKKQPTAYDLDEVLERLEDEKSHMSLLYDELEIYKSAIDDAIEIVKAVGMTSD